MRQFGNVQMHKYARIVISKKVIEMHYFKSRKWIQREISLLKHRHDHGLFMSTLTRKSSPKV